MRKVIFKKWIPETILIGANGIGKTKEGTMCFSPKFNGKGVFHQWGLAIAETSDNVASYSVALIETEDGSIEEVDPSNLKFVTPVI